MKIIIPSNIRQILRDYRLPIAATLAFVVVIVFLFIGRLQERGSLGQVFAVNKSNGGDYAGLLSNDKGDDFIKRDVSAEDTTTNNTSNKTATAIASGSSTPTPTSSSSGSSGESAPVSGNSPVVVPQPFIASITAFQQDQSPSLQCPNGLLGNININKCSKTYSFAASVQTSNGPGTVKYDWRYSVSGSSNGSFVAASGTNVTTLHNQLTLSCKDPISFTAQFALSSPSAVQSTIMRVNHTCN